MFGRKNENKAPGKIDSLIGAGTQIEGSIRFVGGLRVDGEIKGSVEACESSSPSVLVLSEKARIEGAVSVGHMIINGTIVGPVRALSSLEMHAQSKIIGDVEYGCIEMHQGAIIEGHLLHRSDKTIEAISPEPNPENTDQKV